MLYLNLTRLVKGLYPLPAGSGVSSTSIGETVTLIKIDYWASPLLGGLSAFLSPVCHNDAAKDKSRGPN